MVSTRGGRRPSSNDLEELGLDGAKKPPPKTAPPSPEDEGSEERDTEAASEEESENSGDAKHAPAGAAPKPTATPKQAKRPSPSPPPEEEEEEGAGAQGSGVAPPVRGGTLDELAAAAAAVAAAPPPRQKLKTKKTTKRLKRPPPLSQDADVAPPDPNNSGASSPTPKRAKRRATPPQEEEEQEEKRAAGSDGDGTDLPPGETDAPPDKVRHKKNKKNKPGKVLAKPLQPDSAELGLTGNRGEVLHAGNTPSLQEQDDAQEEDPQRKEMPGQEDADNTSLPQVNGSAHEEEEQWEEDAGQEHAEEEQWEEDAGQEHADNMSPPQQENNTREDDDDIGVEVFGVADRIAYSAKLRSSKGENSKGEKKPAVERTWSHDDELKILTALVEHAQSHNGGLPDSSHLLANLTFDKTDANAYKLDDKIRKLRAKYRNGKVRPTDDRGRRLFDLSHILWAEVDDDARVDVADSTRDFNELSGLYPYLAKEVKVYAETHSSGDLILTAFANIGDEKARHLDAMCKKQRFEAFKLELMKANLELSQANLTKEMLSALSSRIIN